MVDKEYNEWCRMREPLKNIQMKEDEWYNWSFCRGPYNHKKRDSGYLIKQHKTFFKKHSWLSHSQTFLWDVRKLTSEQTIVHPLHFTHHQQSFMKFSWMLIGTLKCCKTLSNKSLKYPVEKTSVSGCALFCSNRDTFCLYLVKTFAHLLSIYPKV